ncbi:C1 family peptidase [Bacteroidia bacterium]|nr:C1 family peptidase [Bacteroidia bacterium]
MNFKKYIVLIFLFSNLFSFSQGLKFNKDSFLLTPKFEMTRGTVYSSYSLEKYAPTSYPQIGGTCVAHSFCNARTILMNLELGRTTNVNAYSFSPFHFYFEASDGASDNCEDGLNITHAANVALNEGFALLGDVEYSSYYPYTMTFRCEYTYPDYYTNAQYAKKYKPDNIYRIENVRDLKSALCENMPVVIGMGIPSSFKDITYQHVWTPSYYDSYKNASLHAMLAVGYDDYYLGGAVRILNSWGQDWGDDGYIWIKYQHFANWFTGGFAVEKYTSTRGSDNIASKEDILKSYLIEKNDENKYGYLENLLKQKNIIGSDTSDANISSSDSLQLIKSIDGFPDRKHNPDVMKRAFGIKE